MIVRELIELLSNAAPPATVTLLDDLHKSNAQAIKSLKVGNSA
jgi:hypothetical protein